MNDTDAVIVRTARTAIGRAHKGSLGHPIAATGARLVVSTVAELQRRDARLACISMCSRGGMGAALVLERLGSCAWRAREGR